ncbi:AAA family ATPase [Polynucleobacter nymphae]|uniref:AAA family ATPase n=1 Tax=Polynucleobacter nymphae TaxID=2081043 RepID=UPI001C0BC5A8|nr:AAA family ATPase [Polynucleobacter nymphae]MBU3606873.1 AAA family ATPase [Polynucleobacter nymphae]
MIKFSFGNGEADNKPEQLEADDFKDLVQWMVNNHSEAKGGNFFCAAMSYGHHDKIKDYPDENYWRLKSHTLPRRILSMDLDGFEKPEVWVWLRQWIRDLEVNVFWYETSSSTVLLPRARLVFELKREVDYEEGKVLGSALQAHIEEAAIGAGYSEQAINFDISVYRGSQPVFLPVFKNKEAFKQMLLEDRIYRETSAAPLDVDTVLKVAPERITRKQKRAVNKAWGSYSINEQQQILDKFKAAKQKWGKALADTSGKSNKVAQEAYEEMLSLGSEWSWCWQFDDDSYKTVINELTKGDLTIEDEGPEKVSRESWYKSVMLGARFTAYNDIYNDKFHKDILDWSQAHWCWEVDEGKAESEFESVWDTGLYTLNESNFPLKTLLYLRGQKDRNGNYYLMPKLILADGSLADVLGKSAFIVKNDVTHDVVIQGSSSLATQKQKSTKTLESLFTCLTLDTEDVKSMEEATFIIPNLIVRGHLHALIAEANGGKTALMIHQAAKIAEQGFDVYYVNADAGPGDLKSHFAHAQIHGYKVIAPDAKRGGSPEQVVALFKEAANNDVDMSNSVFIMDTLKKFTEVIQKSDAKEFYKLLRKLTVKGATVILLGHSNKYRGEDGKQVYEGTADLRNDVDNLIYLNSVKNEGTNRLEITTQPDKIRADYKPRSFFINLSDRSVEETDEVVQILDKERQQALKYAKEAIANGTTTKVAIAEFIKDKTSFGKNRLLRFLDEFTRGSHPSIYAQVGGGEKNATIYSLQPPTFQEISAVLEQAFGDAK